MDRRRNNVCAALAEACALLGPGLICASAPEYGPADASIALADDPRVAVEGAHVVATDVWTSMGQEAEREAGHHAFAGYTVDDYLLGFADPEAIVLHCLPAHPGEEIAADVLYGPRSAVWDESENRLHTAKAVLALTIS